MLRTFSKFLFMANPLRKQDVTRPPWIDAPALRKKNGSRENRSPACVEKSAYLAVSGLLVKPFLRLNTEGVAEELSDRRPAGIVQIAGTGADKGLELDPCFLFLPVAALPGKPLALILVEDA